MQQPQVVTWFKVYAGFMVLLYLAVTCGGIFLVTNPDALTDPNAGPMSNAPNSTDQTMIMGVIYTALGVVLAIAFIVGLLAPQRFWSWVYSLVLICLGLTSCCLLPATVPLLIFWIKEPTRKWYKGEFN